MSASAAIRLSTAPPHTLPGDVVVGGVRVPGRVWAAPMTGVSDLPCRLLMSGLGAPYVATEMVACAELARGRPDVVRRAAVGDGLPLTVIQLVGADPAMIAEGARAAERAGADLIDLNFGCPAKEVTGARCGSALMRDLPAAERLVAAAAEATSRPVTVKMRLGWDDAGRNAPELARRAAAAGAQGFTVHGRTRAQGYGGRADWSAVREVLEAAGPLPVVVNGDVVDLPSAREALARSGAAAVMVGRGAYGRPWLMAALDRALATGAPALDEPDGATRYALAVGHLRAALRFYGDALGLRVFRKHLGWYVEAAPFPADPLSRRAAKAQLCRLDDPGAVERALAALWLAPADARAA